MKKVLTKCYFNFTKFAVVAALIIAPALMITACMEPTGGPGGGGEQRTVLRLNMDGNGKTIMPATTLTNFNYFTVSIASGSDIVADPTQVTGATQGQFNSATVLNSHNFSVAVGTNYDITVNAYLDGGTVIAATWTGTSGAITSTPTPIAVPLAPRATGDGNFAWNLSYGTAGTNFTSLTTATLTVVNIDGTSTAFTLVDLGTLGNEVNTTGVPLPAGEYRAVVAMTLSDSQPRTVTEILHIYPGMTSTWTETFVTVNTIPSYNVTFNNVDGVGTNNTVSYPHGTFLSDDPPYPYTGGPTHDDGNTPFIAWHNIATFTPGPTSATAVNIDSTRVFGARNLYAEWQSRVNGNLTVSFILVDEGLTFSLDGNPSMSISMADVISGTSITLTIDDNSLSNYSWRLNNSVLSSTNTFVFGYDTTDSTTEAATVQFTYPGDYLISVEAVKDGKTYSRIFMITVTS